MNIRRFKFLDKFHVCFSHFKIEAANYLHCRALAEKQAAMVMAAAEAKRRTMMETSTNGALRGGCCARC